jgi:glycosyltransferase involved in cell wall biosynthesis
MKFTVIITCYNREKTIIRSIDSVLNQTYQDFELIVVDDASKDKSVEIISTVADPRLRLVQQPVNKGQNAALNAGILQARNEILAFLDSDDIWFPEYLEKVNAKFTGDPKIGFVYALMKDGPQWTLEGANKYKEALSQGYISSMIAICAKRSAVIEAGMFDENFTVCQDDDFCLSLAKKNSFALIREPLVLVHKDAGNRMTSSTRKYALGWEKLFRKYKSDIIEFCGYQTLAKHYFTLSNLFMKGNSYFSAIKYLGLSIYNFYKPVRTGNIHEFDPNEYRIKLKEQFIRLTKKGVKSILFIK